MATIYCSVIKNFLEKHRDLQDHDFKRGAYIRFGSEERFIFECREFKGMKKTFVFIYDCGIFSECHTEYNAFDKYLFSMVCECDFMEKFNA